MPIEKDGVLYVAEGGHNDNLTGETISNIVAESGLVKACVYFILHKDIVEAS